MGEAKRITQEGRAARVATARAKAVETTRDRQRRVVDTLWHIVQRRMRDLTPEQMTTVLGTTIGVFAASYGGPEGANAVAAQVDAVARDVIDQAGETVP